MIEPIHYSVHFFICTVAVSISGLLLFEYRHVKQDVRFEKSLVPMFRYMPKNCHQAYRIPHTFALRAASVAELMLLNQRDALTFRDLMKAWAGLCEEQQDVARRQCLHHHMA